MNLLEAAVFQLSLLLFGLFLVFHITTAASPVKGSDYQNAGLVVKEAKEKLLGRLYEAMQQADSSNGKKPNTIPYVFPNFSTLKKPKLTKREVNFDRIRVKGNRTECAVQKMVVNFKAIGWNWIIAPEELEVNYCSGKCTKPFNQKIRNNHAVLIDFVRMTKIGKYFPKLPELACVPVKMSSIRLLFFNKDGVVVIRKFKHMTVKSCGCRA